LNANSFGSSAPLEEPIVDPISNAKQVEEPFDPVD
jgi:hypothetical protein